MEDSCGESLAGSGLARKKQRTEWHRGELREQVAYGTRGGARTDVRIERVLPVLRGALLSQATVRARAARCARDHKVEPPGIARLLEEIERAQPQASHGIADRPVAGE